MFTGIVQLVGRIERTDPRHGGLSLQISLPGQLPPSWLPAPGAGESISVDGVCLTVEADSVDHRLVFFASEETLNKTTLRERQPGHVVNLERAATLQSLLGGHLVSGHVDGRGELIALREDGGSRVVTFEIPAPLTRYIVEKGSIAIDGISLTAVNVQERRFDVWIIPHTWAATALSARRPGSKVNIECDVIAKLVEKQLTPWLDGACGGVGPGATRDLGALLQQAGFKH